MANIGSEEGLHAVELRVLACLVEKQLATPEYYPLTRNALLAACNQKSNRDPVMELDEETLDAAMRALRAFDLLVIRTGPKFRKEKYGHRLAERLELPHQHLAVLCELMLRGPQTPGALRNRCSRMAPFPDRAAVEATLDELADREGEPLVVLLPRRPGQSEPRWGHLLGYDTVPEEQVDAPPAPAAPHRPAPAVPPPATLAPDALAELRAEVRALADALRVLEGRFEEFRRQFE